MKHKNCVSVYHASLSDSLKAFNCSTFRSPSSELRCLVATVAFGMVRINFFFEIEIKKLPD